MRKILYLFIVLAVIFCSFNIIAYASTHIEIFESYDEGILSGMIVLSYGDDVDSSSVYADIYAAMFRIKNNSKSPMDLKKIKYRAIDKNGAIYKLENPDVVSNGGVSGSSILNPNQRADVLCVTPFRKRSDVENIEEVYIKIGTKRIFFVREDKIEESSKLENKMLRHARNFWWNIK